MAAQVLAEGGCYQVVCDEQIEQGDFFTDLQVYVQGLPEENTELHPIEHVGCAIVLSQSCDHALERGDSQALLCQVITLSAIVEQIGEPRSKELWGRARSGREVNYHPLLQCDLDGFQRQASLVNFREPFNVRLDALQQRCRDERPRLRLRPPYREQLAQQFARKMMRVALPVDFPEWKDLPKN